jgi:hypothetical protein
MAYLATVAGLAVLAGFDALDVTVAAWTALIPWAELAVSTAFPGFTIVVAAWPALAA